MTIKGTEELDTQPEETQPESLRDTIEQAVSEVEQAEAPETTEIQEPEQTPEVVEDDKGRLRDKSGKFVSKEPKEGDVVEQPVDKSVEPEPEPVNPPSSWKKDYHETWGALPREIQEYINQREAEYAKGVHTYKSEYEAIRPLREALEPFMPVLQQHNIEPGRWISSLGNAHMMLAQGSPEQKLSMFMKLVQDYRVPVEHLFTQGEDGKIYFNPQVQQHRPPPQAQGPDIDALIERKMQEKYSIQQIQDFSTKVDADGNPAYPHFETVKETMAQLLEAGLADDLIDAYDAALRHPRHADLYESDLKQRKDAEERARQEEIKREAQRAKGNNVSVKGKTPATRSVDSPKGVRGAIESAMDSVLADRI